MSLIFGVPCFYSNQINRNLKFKAIELFGDKDKFQNVFGYDLEILFINFQEREFNLQIYKLIQSRQHCFTFLYFRISLFYKTRKRIFFILIVYIQLNRKKINQILKRFLPKVEDLVSFLLSVNREFLICFDDNRAFQFRSNFPN
ncbi:hypothetical protein BpHYR1_013742 [Brachionus plicatilis]|uniref:Uncharacterized protein n=1 Tax=Brachionus plicatilis TaxID=10195 RepID=A0A3M7PAD1_BRAPC|nr:hypothetical protein BpHYR1_013742 [Brachionus plicatilis]